MAGNETDMRIKADNRLAAARNGKASRETIAQLQAERDAARSKELGKTGGNRQAGER